MGAYNLTIASDNAIAGGPFDATKMIDADGAGRCASGTQPSVPSNSPLAIVQMSQISVLLTTRRSR